MNCIVHVQENSRPLSPYSICIGWKVMSFIPFISFIYFNFFLQVAEGVTAINQAIDAQDERLLMAALTYPRASIYGVTSKCIQEYLEELKKLKNSKKDTGQ